MVSPYNGRTLKFLECFKIYSIMLDSLTWHKCKCFYLHLVKGKKKDKVKKAVEWGRGGLN